MNVQKREHRFSLGLDAAKNMYPSKKASIKSCSELIFV